MLLSLLCKQVLKYTINQWLLSSVTYKRAKYVCWLSKSSLLFSTAWSIRPLSLNNWHVALNFEHLPTHVCIGYTTLIKKNSNDMPYHIKENVERCKRDAGWHPSFMFISLHLKEAVGEFNATIKHAKVKLADRLATCICEVVIVDL